MSESMNAIFTAEQEQQMPVPKIFDLIKGKASVESIVQQIYQDCYSEEYDPEKIFLGFKELLNRGLEGQAVIKMLANGSDRLATIAQSVANITDQPDQHLEDILGIKRWGKVFTENPSDPISKIMFAAYNHAVEKGFTKLSYDECMKQYHDLSTAIQAPHLSGSIEKEIISGSATFGAYEPGYLELMGPFEILNLRSKPDSNFLLLGSYGIYSARDFRKFTAKINPNIRTNVIDISSVSIEKIRNDEMNQDNILVQADASQLPYAENSMDYIFSNFLFHFLDKNEGDLSHEEQVKKIASLFNEVFRVLEPGGCYVAIEKRYGAYSEQHDTPDIKEKIRREIKSVALQAGFQIVETMNYVPSYMLTPESTSAEIDKNGFPHYEESFVYKDDFAVIATRFYKPLS